MELASVLIAVLPVLLVAALVLCYVCVLRRLCCDAGPRRPQQPSSLSGAGSGPPAPHAPSASRSTSVWCWWGDSQQHEELQLTNTTHLDSQAAAGAS